MVQVDASDSRTQPIIACEWTHAWLLGKQEPPKRATILRNGQHKVFFVQRVRVPHSWQICLDLLCPARTLGLTKRQQEGAQLERFPAVLALKLLASQVITQIRSTSRSYGCASLPNATFKVSYPSRRCNAWRQVRQSFSLGQPAGNAKQVISAPFPCNKSCMQSFPTSAHNA